MSAKLIGIPEWVVQAGYPEVSGQDGDETVTVKITATAAGIAKNLPRYGQYFSSDDEFFARFSYLQLTGRTVALNLGKKTYSITLTYSVKEADEGEESTVKRDVEYTTQDTDVPLAQHKNYRVRWNHILLTSGADNSVPDWWESATDVKIPAGDAEKYVWALPDDKIPDGWRCLCAQTKPGVESYRSGVCTVTEISRSTNKSYLQRTAASDYTIQKPPDTFGRPGEWLRGGSSIRKSGNYWELTVSYLNSTKIDRELYS